jgi:glycosyltransferase involved in cell wall biosynthesis
MTNNTYNASIVVPVFNTEAFLPNCIDSLLGQTMSSFEIVIIDDGSLGDCLCVVEKYRSIRPDIKYFRHKKNLGILCARFTGAERSAGDYVGYLDSDDSAQSNFVELLLATAVETNAEIVGSMGSEKDQSSKFIVNGAEGILKAYADRSIPNYNVWSKMYKKSLILSLEDLRSFASMNHCSNSEDLLFNVFCALKNPTYVNIPQVLVNHNRKRQGSATNPKTVDDARKALDESMLVHELLRDRTSGFEQFVEQLIERSVRYNYKQLVAGYGEKDFEWAISAFMRRPSGQLYLGSMARTLRNELEEKEEKLRAAREALVIERKKQETQRKELLIVRQKLTASQDKLKNERKERQLLKSKLKEGLTPWKFSQRLLKFLRDRLIIPQARARKAWQNLFRR